MRIAALTCTSITAIARTNGKARTDAASPSGNGSYTVAMATSTHPPICDSRSFGRSNNEKANHERNELVGEENNLRGFRRAVEFVPDFSVHDHFQI